MSVVAAKGFRAAGGVCGIKSGAVPDLAIVATADGDIVPAAGVFTTNLAAAAPVQVSRAHLVDGVAAAVVLSSGNANAATGTQGLDDARRMCELTAQGLGLSAPSDVLVCSTGLIGFPMPRAALEAGVPALAAALASTPPGSLDGGAQAARAILTTDSVPKEAVAPVAGTGAVVGGIAKGAAMLAPAMATMLAVLTTDASMTSPALQRALAQAVHDTFNMLCVDACTSTNDTVLVLANGAAGGAPIGETRGPAYAALVDALSDVCGSLAEQMARDAEGATVLARIIVRSARSAEDARRAARAVASSQLVQCSLNGRDPYWGRVLSELGASGALIDPDRVDIAYQDVVVCRGGVGRPHDEAALAESMSGPEITIVADLNLGTSEATMLCTDLSYGYIDENARTS